MNKIPIEVVALSNSVTQSQSYAVVLEEVGGIRKLPIIIGSFEAQSIAVALEQITPSRPLTHDLMTNMMNLFGIVLMEVVIYKLVEGIFFAHLVCEKDGKVIEIDSRTSDAIALAIRNSCPIFTFEEILNEASGLSGGGDSIGSPKINKENVEKEEKPKPKKRKEAGSTLTHYTTAELKSMMQKATSNEDYDLAIQIRDELKNRGESE